MSSSRSNPPLFFLFNIYSQNREAGIEELRKGNKGELLLREHIGSQPVDLDKAKGRALLKVQELLQERKGRTLEAKI